MGPKTFPARLMLLSFFVLSAALFTAAQETAETSAFKFEVFELPNGVMGNSVTSITQDSFGFLWFGSHQGLHRWDGHRFKTYLHVDFDSSSLSSSYIEYLFIDRSGNLWVGTWGGGLNKFHYPTETFTRYTHDPNTPSSLSNDFVSEIVEDQQGFLWIATQVGLNRFDPATGAFKVFLHDPSDKNSISYNTCRALWVDSAGTLWIGTGLIWGGEKNGGLNKYDPNTESFTRYVHDPNNPASIKSNIITELFEDSRGVFWVGTAEGSLYQMDRKTGTFTLAAGNLQVKDNTTDTNSPDRHVRNIIEDGDQTLWICAWREGLKHYDPKTGTVLYKENHDKEEVDYSHFPWAIFQSRDGVLWGSGSRRVFKVLRPSTIIDHYIELSGPTISFLQKDLTLWVGTKSAGFKIFLMPTIWEQTSYYNDPLNPLKIEEISSLESNLINPLKPKLFDFITHIELDSSGFLWLSLFPAKDPTRPALIRFHPPSGALVKFFAQQDDPSSLSDALITDMLKDKSGNIWIITAYGVLHQYSFEKEAFQRYELPVSFPAGAHQNSQSSEAPRSMRIKMTRAHDGTLWLAGNYLDPQLGPVFLLRFNPTDKSFEQIPLEKGKPDFNQHNWVNRIKVDTDGNLWLLTRSELRKINIDSKETTFFLPHQLKSTSFYDMCFDEQGLLWIAGDHLIMVDPANPRRPLISSLLLPAPRDPWWRTMYKTPTGRFIFPSETGFIIFNPDAFKSRGSKYPLEVRITHFQLHDRTKEKQEDPLLSFDFWKKPELKIHYTQNSFTFLFSTMAFSNPEETKYEYQLAGFDNSWRKVVTDPRATYIKVPPGNYTFQVRAAAPNHFWSEPKSIQLSIYPPWWRTWWAYTLYGLLAFGFIFTLYRFQLNRRLEHAEAIRLQELDAVKTRLYTNITHEFRTPITVILGMARQTLENPGEYFSQGLNMIIRNGENLLSLVNQMLDLSKLESGKMDVKMQQGDVIPFLRYLAESFHSLAESKDLQIHFLPADDSIILDYDPEKYQQIVSNLLSNAIKFTPAGGHIYFSTGLLAPDQCYLKIKDTGKGIPEKALPHIFDRFYQVEDTHTRETGGTGIGLALTKELVKLLGGEITAKSQAGKGTEFQIILPVSRQAEKLTSDPISAHAPTTAVDEMVLPTKTKLADDLNQPSILIVEDHPDVIQLLYSYLKDHYQLLTAIDGEEGTAIALEQTPDLIVSDVMMPKKDGFELCKTLKTNERTSHIPIILLTAKADVESKLEGLEGGADAYLTKPFMKEELLVRIKKLLELRKSLQAHYLQSAGLGEPAPPESETPVLEGMEDAFVLKVRDVVEDNLDKYDFTVEQLCREIGMSNSQLHRKLTALIGLSATKFIRHVRLKHARELLLDPELSITAVALDTGFNDPSYFGRVFKAEFGLTPLEWREREMKERLKES